MKKEMPVVTVAKAAIKAPFAVGKMAGQGVRRIVGGISGDGGKLVASAYKPMDPGTTIAIAKRVSKGK